MNNKGFGNYPYYGTSTKFMQMNNKPRQLPCLGEKARRKPKRASSNTKENLSNNQNFIKSEKRDKMISSAFGSKNNRATPEYGDHMRANLPGKFMVSQNIKFCRSED